MTYIYLVPSDGNSHQRHQPVWEEKTQFSYENAPLSHHSYQTGSSSCYCCVTDSDPFCSLEQTLEHYHHCKPTKASIFSLIHELPLRWWWKICRCIQALPVLKTLCVLSSWTEKNPKLKDILTLTIWPRLNTSCYYITYLTSIRRGRRATDFSSTHTYQAWFYI